MDFRSAVNSIISTRERWRRRCARAGRLLEPLDRKTKFLPWPFAASIETPDPVLRQIHKPVETFDDGLKTLVADMFETMYDAPGIGLAAVQVGVPIRLLVIDLQEPADPEDAESRRSATRGSSSTPRSCGTRTARCPTPRAACRCPSNMPR